MAASDSAQLALLRQQLITSEAVYNRELNELVLLMNRAIEWTDMLANPRVKTHAYTTEKVKACSDRLLSQVETGKTKSEEHLYKIFGEHLVNCTEILTYCTQLHDMRCLLLAAGTQQAAVAKASYSHVFKIERALLPLYRLHQLLDMFQEMRLILEKTRRQTELVLCTQRIEQIIQLSTRCTRLLTRLDGSSYISSLPELFDDSPRYASPSQNTALTNAASSAHTKEAHSEHDGLKASKDYTNKHTNYSRSTIDKQHGSKALHSIANSKEPKTGACAALIKEFDDLSMKRRSNLKALATKHTNKSPPGSLSLCGQSVDVDAESSAERSSLKESYSNSVDDEILKSSSPPGQGIGSPSSQSCLRAQLSMSNQLTLQASSIVLTRSDDCTDDENKSVHEIEFKMSKLRNEMKFLEHKLSIARSSASSSEDHKKIRDSDYSSYESLTSLETANEEANKSGTVLKPTWLADIPTETTTSETKENGTLTHSEESKTVKRISLGTIKRWNKSNFERPKSRTPSPDDDFFDSTKYIRERTTTIHLRDSIRRAPLYQSLIQGDNLHDTSSLEESASATDIFSEYQNVNPSFKRATVKVSNPDSGKSNAGIGNILCNAQENGNEYAETYELIGHHTNGQIISSTETTGDTDSHRSKLYLPVEQEDSTYCDMSFGKTNVPEEELPKYDFAKYNKFGSHPGDDAVYVDVVKNSESADDESALGAMYANVRRKERYFDPDAASGARESVRDIFADMQKKEEEKQDSQGNAPNINNTMKGAVRWCTIPQVVNSGLLAGFDKRLRCLHEAKYEIISSKVSYLKSLSILQAVFIQNQELLEILPKHDWDNLFRHIDPVKRCSEHFLADLLSGWPKDLLLSKMATVVNRYAHSGLQVYVDYCANKIRMDDTIRDIRENRPSANQLLQRLEADEACENLPLDSFLLSPIKRVTRFPLLVHGILKRLIPGEEEHTAWMQAFQQLQIMANMCNEAVREEEEKRSKLLASIAATTEKTYRNSTLKKPRDKKAKSKGLGIFSMQKK